MLTQEDLQAISLLLDPINKRLENIEKDVSGLKTDVSALKSDVEEMKKDIDIIKEDTEITRDVTNKIGEWVDFYFHDDKPYPLDEDEMEKYKNGLKFAK